jgi:hypothetical protein
MNSMPPKLGDNPSPSSGNWWARLPTWGKWTGGIIAVIILLGIGGAIGGSGGKEDDLKNEVASLEAEVKSVEGEKQDAEAKASPRPKKSLPWNVRNRKLWKQAKEKPPSF